MTKWSFLIWIVALATPAGAQSVAEYSGRALADTTEAGVLQVNETANGLGEFPAIVSLGVEVVAAARVDVTTRGLQASAIATGLGDEFGRARGGNAQALAFVRFLDWIVDGPTNRVDTSLRIELDGRLQVVDPEPLERTSTADARVHVSLIAIDPRTRERLFIQGGLLVVDSDVYDTAGARIVDETNGLVLDQHLPGGLFEGFTLDDFSVSPGVVALEDLVLETPPFEVPTGVMLWMEIQLTATSEAGSFGPLTLSDSSFDQTLGFPTDQPVMLLPDGYTLNSPSAGIVDNQWQGLPVPEPAAEAYLAASLLGCGILRLRPRASRRRPLSTGLRFVRKQRLLC